MSKPDIRETCGRPTTNTNDTALIEAIKNLPDNEYLGEYDSDRPNHYCLDGNDLKSLVSRLEAAEKERDFAREGCKKALTCASLDSSVRAFIVQSLKGESNDG